jgi:hypothetical protein
MWQVLVQKARAIVEQFGSTVILKAQIHRGDRGKAGGVLIAKAPKEAEKAAAKLLGTRLITNESGPEGLPVISGLKARLKELEKQTADEDLLLLIQLHDAEKQLKYWAGYAHLKTYFAKRDKKLIKEGEPALEIFSILRALAPTPNVDIFDHPQVTITNQIRQMGLYCYVYPKNIEIKGAIKQTYVSSGCS